MPRRLRKLPSLALVLLVPVAVGACGDSHTKVTAGTYAGESGANAPYLDVGQLVYEVQLSRQLNPTDEEDASYLSGLSPAQRQLAPGQEWFGVFMEVFNNHSPPQQASNNLMISDTQGNSYTPVLPESSNPFAYRAGTVRGKSRLPAPDSIAAQATTQGALLLFKIKIASLDNRPLTLRIVDPTDAAETASAELDV